MLKSFYGDINDGSLKNALKITIDAHFYHLYYYKEDSRL